MFVDFEFPAEKSPLTLTSTGTSEEELNLHRLFTHNIYEI